MAEVRSTKLLKEQKEIAETRQCFSQWRF